MPVMIGVEIFVQEHITPEEDSLCNEKGKLKCRQASFVGLLRSESYSLETNVLTTHRRLSNHFRWVSNQ